MSFMNKLLNKSNSYNFYKEHYESLKSNEKKLNKQIKQMDNKLTKNQAEINILNDDLKSNNETISYLNRKLEEYKKVIGAFEDIARQNTLDFSSIDLKDINIAYISHGFPIHSETFIVSEVKWLKENGFNIIIFARNDPYKPVEIDFDVEVIKYKDLWDLEMLLVGHNIQLMHTHFVYPICTTFTYPMAEKLGIPFTVFAHAFDIFIHEHDNLNHVGEISKSEYCKAIFTLSEFHKNYLLERGVDESKIVVTKQASNYELSEIKQKDNKIRNIVSISRFVEKKGIDELIKTAKLLENEDFEFSVYGFGDLENELKKQIEDLGCKNISIKGELPPNEVREVLINSDLLVSPCKVAKNGDMDGFPTVIFEAMAVGLPYLTTAVSAIPEIVEDGVNGFICEPENPEKFAEKIREISEIPNDEMYKIRLQAQNDVKNISSVDKTMNTYIDVISK